MVAYVGDPGSAHFCWVRVPKHLHQEAMSWARRVRNILMRSRPELGIIPCGTHGEEDALRFRTADGRFLFPEWEEGGGDNLGIKMRPVRKRRPSGVKYYRALG